MLENTSDETLISPTVKCSSAASSSSHTGAPSQFFPNSSVVTGVSVLSCQCHFQATQMLEAVCHFNEEHENLRCVISVNRLNLICVCRHFGVNFCVPF